MAHAVVEEVFHIRDDGHALDEIVEESEQMGEHHVHRTFDVAWDSFASSCWGSSSYRHGSHCLRCHLPVETAVVSRAIGVMMMRYSLCLMIPESRELRVLRTPSYSVRKRPYE